MELMKILQFEEGDPDALVQCTACGRITRLRLLGPCRGSEPADFVSPYTCPGCLRVYSGCSRQTPGAASPDQASAADPASEALDRRIELWKRDLLDTGKRNRMINYRETGRSTLRILAPEAAELFNRLAFHSKPLTFQKPVSRNSDVRTYAVISLMETLSYDLDVQTGDIKADGTVMEREKTLKNLRSRAKLALEEQGINLLYLSFGFIYWREKGRTSGPWIRSPLLMMPVSLGQKSPNAPYALTWNDDEIEVNPTLDHFFNVEYHVDLPTFVLKDNGSFDEYVRTIEALTDKQGWKVTREVSLGLFSFLKISMYHDLNRNRDRILQHPVLRAMAGDPSGIPPLPPETADGEQAAAGPEDAFEVLDADASQEEAIRLSRKGVSFVMQGPPGTGKSQTITNIIAAALGDGKKVLFVSEKAAALQVVRKRLTEAGLADFCLSLHSNKVNKKEVVDSLGANLELHVSDRPEDPADMLAELFHDRQFLNDYAAQLHRKLPPLGLSAYEAFGRLAAAADASDVSFVLDEPEKIGPQALAELQFCVANLEKALRQLGGPIRSNPWFGAKASAASQDYRQRFLRATEGLSGELRAVAGAAKPVGDALGVPCTSFREIRRMLDAARLLAECPAPIQRRWFSQEALPSLVRGSAEASEHGRALDRARNAVLQRWQPAVLEPDTAEPLRSGALSRLDGSGTDDPAALLERELADALALRSGLGELRELWEEGSRLLRYAQADDAEQLRLFSRIFGMLADAPCLEAAWFDTRRMSQYRTFIDGAADRCATLRRLERQILAGWDDGVFRLDAGGMLLRFRTDYTRPLHTLRPDYWRDMAQLRACTKDPGSRVEASDATRLLLRLSQYRKAEAWLRANGNRLSEALGSRYAGMDTDWQSLSAGIRLAEELAGLFPYGAMPGETAEAVAALTWDPQGVGAIRRIAAGLAPERLSGIEERLKACLFLPEECRRGSLSGEILPLISSYIAACEGQRELLRTLAPLKRSGGISVGDLRKLSEDLETVRRELAWFDEREPQLRVRFGKAFRSPGSGWEAVSAAVGTAQRLDVLFGGSIPEPLLRLASGEQPEPSGFRADVSALAAPVLSAEPKLEAFEAEFTGRGFADRPPEEAAAACDACREDFVSLSRWLDYTEARADCDRIGLAGFTARLDALNNTVPDVCAAFSRSFYSQWLQRQLEQVPAVRSFRRRVYEQRADRFSELDTRQHALAIERIRDRIVRSFPRADSAAGAGSEQSILLYEMRKKRRIMPLRELFHKIPGLLLTLKPCLMMSPLTVAYFLDANDYRFDMVIFDEASQVFPQDAVGAIFRAGQVIITGDTKQLPPTNFFISGSSSREDGEEEAEAEDPVYDSILEEAADVLPGRPLLWHYRSRHEHLIAFSNQEIYRNQLITFPSSRLNEPDAGVDFIYVEDGFYEPAPKNHNRPEAERIVELVEAHIRNHPDRSLGIIAFSEKQQQAIFAGIQRMRTKHPEYEDFFSEDRDDAFFVKNLENVQGDERDTIFFSIGYAKTKAQKAAGRSMSLRFGPLGVSGGERRLNVAITRAKLNVKLVSSILPEDIDVSRTESEGIRMLRAYMEFAIRGESSLASGRRSRDEFVEAVAQFIRDHGYAVRTYVGCSGNRLDIAVRDPKAPDSRFAAGVLCDGEAYRSARTARDRDRLRNAVLRGMGWELYRVWSPEWYNDPYVEGEKLLSFLASAVRQGGADADGSPRSAPSGAAG